MTLAVAGGASLTIAEGNITFACPGTITIHAGQKSFAGPTSLNYKLPIMPRNVCVECLMKRAAQRSGLVNKGG